MNEALDLLSGLVLEDSRRWGDAAFPCQVADAEAILDVDSATPFSFLTRARGYSKTSDLAGITTAVMLTQLPPGSRLYTVAADLDQGRLTVESIDGFARRTPELRGALEITNSRVTATRTGTTLEVLPADGPSAWGLRPSFVSVDELAQWPSTRGAQELWEAVTSAATKVPGCRLTVLTTAGDPAHWSKRILDHAIAARCLRASCEQPLCFRLWRCSHGLGRHRSTTRHRRRASNDEHSPALFTRGRSLVQSQVRPLETPR